jgi:hypothetical protein
VGAVFELTAFPATERAVLGAASFAVELGVPGNDPDEEAALVIAGYRAVIGAGATVDGCGWLVEVFADTLTMHLLDFEGVLRALVAVAVGGASASSDAGSMSQLQDLEGGIPGARSPDPR